MQKLIEGAHRFQVQEFGKFKELFRRLSKEGQRPHTLFITCSDSRVLAELLTQSAPGDLFVVKNVGNIVPPASVQGETNSTAAAVEFAVDTLGVEDIVVCGHSQCGAMQALMFGVPGLEKQVHLASWIEVAAPVRRLIAENYSHLGCNEEKQRAAEEENVLFALENLKSYPCVEEKLRTGRIRLHGWFFKIANAELFAFDPIQKQFVPLSETGSQSLGSGSHSAQKQ